LDLSERSFGNDTAPAFNHFAKPVDLAAEIDAFEHWCIFRTSGGAIGSRNGAIATEKLDINPVPIHRSPTQRSNLL
jgi:hypothetical protein